MKVQRGRDPGPFSKHAHYKPHLKVCFASRCAYCQIPDDHDCGLEGMTVDHFLNQAEFPQYRLKWSNLYYCCHVCNSSYKKNHPTKAEILQGHRFVDPCKEDPDDHFRMMRDLHTGDYCRIKPLSDPATYMCRILKLNSRKYLRDFWREIDRHEQVENENLANCVATMNSVKADVQCRGSSDAIAHVLRRSEALAKCIKDKLSTIRARRPFPIE